ncbi:hypothetical protein G3I32_10495 [Streptomyces coelicoflavus]|uniref:DUF8017 domain-containing protein n=1 Tax=Streptomyces coelicoflavus TaxID=285562 RepID=A0A7K3PHD3_9ACTN|nr:hypothetical protein [Streptomyces coelicoflavus]NEB09293.1 hypothetical protein [Streptomyces coelicoflavus]
MRPGEQSPTGGPDPRQQPGPYQQPGYHQPPPAGQQPPAPWNAPTVTPGGPSGEGPGGGRAKVVAVVAAAAVVVAAAVTGAVLLGGGTDDEARPGPTASSPAASSPSASADRGRRPGGEALVAMKAPAVLKEKWCGSDGDRDGSVDYTPLAGAGTRGNNGARSTEEIARNDSANWVYGAFAQPDRDKVTTEPVTRFTTDSGIEGSLATSRSSGVAKQGKCDVNGKAATFAFESADGDLVSWSFYGAADVADEVPDSTVREILATLREYTPSDS